MQQRATASKHFTDPPAGQPLFTGEFLQGGGAGTEGLSLEI